MDTPYESSCILYLKKYVDDCDDVNEVFLKLEDDICSGGVNGPDRHPSSALFYMFEQVYRSGTWKLASCPHCAGEVQRQSSEVKHKDDDILQTSLDSFPTDKQLRKSTSFEQDRTTNM
ncbi:hypothetical protein A2U01_0023797, partial [Trifolium medium]|nr:hypothetical protein [Trifolium medium]